MKVESRIVREDALGTTYIYVVLVIDGGQYETKELIVSAPTNEIGHLDVETATFSDYRNAAFNERRSSR